MWVKKYVKIREMLFKNWKWLFKNTNQTPPKSFLAFVWLQENKGKHHWSPSKSDPNQTSNPKKQPQLKPISHQHSISENHFSDPKQSRNSFCRLVMFSCCGRSRSWLPLSTTTSDCHQTLCLYRPCLSLLFSVLTEASWPWLLDQLLLPLTATTTVDDDVSNWLSLSPCFFLYSICCSQITPSFISLVPSSWSLDNFARHRHG